MRVNSHMKKCVITFYVDDLPSELRNSSELQTDIFRYVLHMEVEPILTW